MADFKTHLGFATVISAGAITLVPSSQGLTFPLLVAIGSVGGMLPDIDSDTSRPTKMLFMYISIMISATLFGIYYNYSILTAVIMGIVGLFLTMYIVRPVFFKFTKHRGIFHSVPMAMMFGIVLYYFLLEYFSYSFALYSGMFLTLGYVTHLALDEIYSVDVMGAEIKRSFGTAVKIFEKDRKLLYISLYIIILFFLLDILK